MKITADASPSASDVADSPYPPRKPSVSVSNGKQEPGRFKSFLQQLPFVNGREEKPSVKPAVKPKNGDFPALSLDRSCCSCVSSCTYNSNISSQKISSLSFALSCVHMNSGSQHLISNQCHQTNQTMTRLLNCLTALLLRIPFFASSSWLDTLASLV